MKDLLLISYIFLIGNYACAQEPGTYHHSKEIETVKGWVGTEERTLTLNDDHTFTYLIRYANSCIPGEYAGTWATEDHILTLTDISDGEPVRIKFALRCKGMLVSRDQKDRFSLLLTSR